MGANHKLDLPVLLAGLAFALVTGQSGPAAEAAQLRGSGTVRVVGATLRYVIEGNGAPCLVVGSSIVYRRAFSKNLRRHLKLVFVDLRHFVPSDPSLDVRQITLDTYAGDIEAVRKELGLSRVIVLGHSIHGDIALEYARRYPESVSHVVVIGSPPVGTSQMSEPVRLFWEADASEERKRVLKQNWEGMEGAVDNLPASQRFIRTYVLNGPRYWYDPKYDSTWLWEGVQINVPVLDHLFGVLFSQYDLALGPRPITAPVFLALGRYDYAVPYTTWEKEKHKLPDLSYNLFEKSGHTPQLEDATEFDQRLLQWLRSR